MKSNVVPVVRGAVVLVVIGLFAACASQRGKIVQTALTPEDLEEALARVEDPALFAQCKVFIRLAGNASSYQWVVAPRTCQVCKTKKEDCDNTVQWRWVGQDIEGVTVSVERKTGQPDCFNLVQLQDPPGSQTETVKAGAGCPVGSEWEYKVSCEDNSDCPAALDPVVIIRN